MGVRKLSQEEIKAGELEILLAFDAYCKRHDLAYSLIGGTLLGAVRHKGFIPWDDDIDVGMPRPHFDRLMSEAEQFKQETGYRVGGYADVPGSITPLAKVLDESVILESIMEREQPHLWIDIMPVDAYPDDLSTAEQHYREASKLRIQFGAAYANPRGSTTLAKRVVKTLLQPVYRAFPLGKSYARKLDALARSVPYGSTGYVGVLTWGLYGVGERMAIEAFENKVDVEFEGHALPAMSCWKEYLTSIYGDYMQLPPEEERKTHRFEAWKIEHDEGETRNTPAPQHGDEVE